MDKVIVLVGGIARSGKDSFIDMCLENVDGYKISMIDPVKEAASCLGVVDPDKGEKYRKFLANMKALWDGTYNGSFAYLKKQYSNMTNGQVLFVLVRKPEEIEQIVKHYGHRGYCVTVMLSRKGIDVPENSADMTTENYDYDMIVCNNETLEELEYQCHAFVEYLDSNYNIFTF